MSTEPFSAGQYQALAALQNELGRFVVEEHAVQREAMHQLWATPLDERVEEGRCIAGLRVVSSPVAAGSTWPSRARACGF